MSFLIKVLKTCDLLTSDVEFWLVCVRSGVPFLRQMSVKIHKLIRSFPMTGLTGTCQHENGERAETRRTEGGGETMAWQRHKLYTNVSWQFIHLYLDMFEHPALILLFLFLCTYLSSVCMEMTGTSVSFMFLK